MIDHKSKCECSLAISLVGDGCRHCQPQEYIENLQTWFDEERAENEKLRRLVKEYFTCGDTPARSYADMEKFKLAESALRAAIWE